MFSLESWLAYSFFSFLLLTTLLLYVVPDPVFNNHAISMQEAPKVEKQDTDGSPHHNDAMTSALVAELSWVQ